MRGIAVDNALEAFMFTEYGTDLGTDFGTDFGTGFGTDFRGETNVNYLLHVRTFSRDITRLGCDEVGHNPKTLRKCVRACVPKP